MSSKVHSELQLLDHVLEMARMEEATPPTSSISPAGVHHDAYSKPEIALGKAEMGVIETHDLDVIRETKIAGMRSANQSSASLAGSDANTETGAASGRCGSGVPAPAPDIASIRCIKLERSSSVHSKSGSFRHLVVCGGSRAQSPSDSGSDGERGDPSGQAQRPQRRISSPAASAISDVGGEDILAHDVGIDGGPMDCKSDGGEDLELNVVSTVKLRYKPESIQQLVNKTRFNKRELQVIYRGFKQKCPRGIVDKETFIDIYQQYFPQGDASLYATHVFDTIDEEKKGSVTFDDFVTGLSILSRGSIEDKLRWVFRLYDVNSDGQINKEEMVDIVRAIYEMMGQYANPPVSEEAIKTHVDKVFVKMDWDQDGSITSEEFLTASKQDSIVQNSMGFFDTIFT